MSTRFNALVESLAPKSAYSVRRQFRYAKRERLGCLFVFVLVLITTSPIHLVHAARGTCGQSEPESLDYKIQICLVSPGAFSVVSGAVQVTSEATVVGPDPLTRRVVFYLDGSYLLTDYQTPFTFQLGTQRYPNGSHELEVEYVMRDGFVSLRTAETIEIENSVTSSSPKTTTFTPSKGRPVTQGEKYVVAVAGDGAGGDKNEMAATDMISDWDPNLVLYLGDVYDRGSPSEFDNWYGNPNSLFGRFRDITDPVIGNHEYQTPKAAGYFSYWNSIPHYYSFDAGGWHFIALDSTTEFDQTSPGTEQYRWLLQDLAANKSVCTLVFLHHPFYSVGEHGNSPQLSDLWPLLVSTGVDLVLSGHDHSYQRWQPLGSDGNPDPKGTTQFVVGTGGHSIRNDVRTDSSLVVDVDTPSAGYGALRLSLTPSSAVYEFLNIKGDTLDTGTVNCSTAGARNSETIADTANKLQKPVTGLNKKPALSANVTKLNLIPAVLILVFLAAGVALGFAIRVIAEDSDSS